MRISKENSRFRIYWYEDTKTIIVYDPMPMRYFLGLKKFLYNHRKRFDYNNIIIQTNGGIKWI